jgi:hypothetical protein
MASDRTLNHDMIAVAKNRGIVVVTTESGHLAPARLLAWEPKRGERRLWGRARVEFASGKAATVTTDRVTPVKMDIAPTRCAECGRVFDLSDRTDAEEWHYGHDCEA